MKGKSLRFRPWSGRPIWHWRYTLGIPKSWILVSLVRSMAIVINSGREDMLAWRRWEMIWRLKSIPKSVLRSSCRCSSMLTDFPNSAMICSQVRSEMFTSSGLSCWRAEFCNGSKRACIGITRIAKAEALGSGGDYSWIGVV